MQENHINGQEERDIVATSEPHAARDDGAVFTRYGREVKAPDGLNL